MTDELERLRRYIDEMEGDRPKRKPPNKPDDDEDPDDDDEDGDQTEANGPKRKPAV